MSEDADTPQDVRNIYQRIEEARKNFPVIRKNTTGQVGTRQYQYADLTSVVEGVENALRHEGVAIFPQIFNSEYHTHTYVGMELRVVATVPGGVGEFIRSVLPLADDLTPQQVGSAITYYRRYLLVLMLNLLTEDDDDGSRATQRPVTKVEPETTPPSVPEGWDSIEQATAAHSDLTDRVRALPADQASEVIQFRDSEGWAAPYTLAQFNQLDEMVEFFHS